MRLSVQLYTVRNAIAKDLPGTLAKLKEMGLEYVEFAGLGDHSIDEWKSLLHENGLKVNAAHVGMQAIEGDIDAVIDEAHTLGYKFVVIPWIGKEAYADGWDKFAESLEPIAQRLNVDGLTLGYHNHAFEFEDGGLDAFYAAANPVIIKAQLDLAWVKIGGADPVAYIEKMSDRLPLVHLKDYDPTQTPQWRPAGQGVMDFDAILAACETVGVEFGTIELDESPGDEVEAVAESVEFFHAKGLR